MARFTEGRAWIRGCPKPLCGLPVIEAHVYGMKLRLSTRAISYKDALILQKYERIITNVWKGETQLWATLWFRSEGPVQRGRLYPRHICGHSK